MTEGEEENRASTKISQQRQNSTKTLQKNSLSNFRLKLDIVSANLNNNFSGLL